MKLQKKGLRYLCVNSAQVAHEVASFVDIRSTLEHEVGGGLDAHPAITGTV